MLFFYGNRLYGKVDHVPGLFYVVTSFAHFNFLPLFPNDSYLVRDDGKGENGIKIELSLKSMVMAWLRAACFFGGLVVLVVGSRGHRSETPLPAGAFISCAVLVLVGVLSCYIIRIGRNRAVALAKRAGLDPTIVHRHFDLKERGATASPLPEMPPLPRTSSDAFKRWND